MKETLRLVVVLTAICLFAGLLLAWVSGITEAPIKAAARAEKTAAIRTVLPEFDNEPDADARTIDAGGRAWTFYIGRKEGRFVGAAFETMSNAGYGGEIAVMVGVNAADEVTAIEILRAKETPGLGAKIADPTFKALFAGKHAGRTNWKVRKDQGEIDELTAATISSRAVVAAVKEGLDVYLARRGEIVEGADHVVSQ
jgi:electron transport complex protein RnfG